MMENKPARPEGLRLFIVAGEPSGDQLGARLIAALRAELAARGESGLALAGVGGKLLESQGLVSLFPMEELSVMGLVEVLPHLRRLARRLSETAAGARAFAPDIVLTIDSPGFTMRLARRLREGEGPRLRLVHYVAPTVWAWKPERAAKLAALYDQLLVLLPFEPPYFAPLGLRTDFVGHPAVELAAEPDRTNFRSTHGIAADTPVLALLPGSRAGELRRHLPPFLDAARRLRERHPRLHVVTPTVGTVRLQLEAALAKSGVPHTVGVFAGAEKRAAFAACDVALAASGTVATELAALRRPTVVAYRVNPLTYRLLRRLVRVRYVTITNLLLDREAIPERLQAACNGPGLADALDRLLCDPAAREEQQQAMAEAMAMLGEGMALRPSARAARVLLDGLPAHSSCR